MLTRNDFDRLAQTHDAPCVTLYIPTHRAGEQTRNGHDALVLKDALKDARAQLEARGELEGRDVDALLAPAQALVDDSTFWTHQSDALAVYLSGGEMEHFSLPIPMEAPMVHVGDRYALAFAARMLAPGARWYVFAVTQNSNAFYECTRNSVTPIRIGDLVPENMEEVLEIYEGSETLQHHGTPVAGAGGGTQFHGQGSNEDRRDERLGIYFRRIGNGVTDLIAGQEEPLVIAADAQHVEGIRTSIDYPHIADEAVTTHPSVLDPVALQRDSWPIVQPLFDKSADELQDKFASATGGGTLANGLADVVRAAKMGQVAALYVAEEAQGRMGRYDAESATVTFGSDAGDENLLEVAIRETIAKGGQVLFRLAEQVPDATDGVTAVLRFGVAAN